MKRVLKVLNVFFILLLVVGCTTSQSVTLKLAGEYIDKDDDGDVNKTIILEKPKSGDDTSGNATYKLLDANDTIYYGTYKVYENTKTVVIE